MTSIRAVSALILVLVTAPMVFAQEVKVSQSANAIEISGGAGPSAWKLRYGSRPQVPVVVHQESPGRALFTIGGWLRQVDTATGMVTARWRFPHYIERISPDGSGRLNIELRAPGWLDVKSLPVKFDPASPVAPNWDVGAAISFRTSEWEGLALLEALNPGKNAWVDPIPKAADAVASLDEMVRRDPLTPYLRLALFKLLQDAGDQRAVTVLQDLFAMPSTDFTEWFRISVALDEMPGAGPAKGREAYDRAFTDFLGRDRDPRMIDTIIARLVIYPPYRDLLDSADGRGRYLEQLYHFAPTSEASERAWALHAQRLAQSGAANAAVWKTRAETAERDSLFLTTTGHQITRDRFLLLEFAMILALLLFLTTRQIKYAPERRMRARAATRQQRMLRWRPGFQYWSRRERWSLLAIAVIGWWAAGFAFVYGGLMQRAFDFPLHAGSFSAAEDFDKTYPASDERVLLKAIALQQSDRAGDAEPLYRSIPQFAESWNNLGVVLTRAGKIDEGRDAFKRALALDPSLPEAVLNATGEAREEITATFKKYLPDAKMISLPSRDRLMRAYFGSSWSNRRVLGWLGPPGGAETFWRQHEFDPIIIAPAVIGGSTLLFFLILSISMLAFIPTTGAGVPPSGVTHLLEHAVPGTSAAWNGWGALVLALWCTSTLAAIFQILLTTPYLTVGRFSPGLMRAFGYPSGMDDVNPPLAALIGVSLILWAMNFWMIRRRRT